MPTLAITQTLKKAHHKLCVFKQLDNLKESIKRILQNLQFSYAYFCFELTQKTVIHAHGYINCYAEHKELNKHIYNELSKQIGFSLIKDIEDEQNHERWYQYMIKDQQTTLKILNEIAQIKLKKQLRIPNIELIKNTKELQLKLSNYNLYGTEEPQE